MPNATITVRDLRRVWKPHKDRLNGHAAEHPTNIRFHRACSWLQRAEQATKDDLDLSLLSQWIAFNAIYGQWDQEVREPLPDNVCWKHFLERMLELDKGNLIVDALVENQPLVMSIFDDEFLSRYFWQEPCEKRASQSKKTKFDARTWLSSATGFSFSTDFSSERTFSVASWYTELRHTTARSIAPQFDIARRRWITCSERFFKSGSASVQKRTGASCVIRR